MPTASPIPCGISRPTAPQPKNCEPGRSVPVCLCGGFLTPVSLGLKDKLPTMDESAQLELLASDGMLVRRPLLVGESTVLVGFRQAEWEQSLL